MTRSLETILQGARNDGPDLPTYEDARAAWHGFRATAGLRPTGTYLLTGGNRKLERAAGVTTYGLTLLPAAHPVIVNGIEYLSNRCPHATVGCITGCVLMTAGNARYSSVQHARAVRTAYAHAFPLHAQVLIVGELERIASKYHSRTRVRLNVASDVRWETLLPLRALHTLATARKRTNVRATFYDYTKWPLENRTLVSPDVYRLTYSVSEQPGSLERAHQYVTNGRNAAVVLRIGRKQPMPATFRGLPLIDGDASDDRTADPNGAWIGLRAKGSATRDTTGFVHNHTN